MRISLRCQGRLNMSQSWDATQSRKPCPALHWQIAPSGAQALQAMADRRNSVPLPALATKYGFRLPPPEDCLIAPNFQFHPQNPIAGMDWEDNTFPSGTVGRLSCLGATVKCQSMCGGCMTRLLDQSYDACQHAMLRSLMVSPASHIAKSKNDNSLRIHSGLVCILVLRTCMST